MSQDPNPNADDALNIEEHVAQPGPPPGKKTHREGRTLWYHGKKYEVIGRYRDGKGQVWCKVKSPMFPDNRPGARKHTKGRHMIAHFPDPAAPQPKSGANIELELE